MLIKEYPFVDTMGVEHPNLEKHYSDKGFYILQNDTGEKYRIAIDAHPCRYTYTETSEKASESRWN